MRMEGSPNKLDRNSQYVKIYDLPSRVNMYQSITSYDLETRILYMTSSFLLCMGYVLFIVGMTSSSWRMEIGYMYGLWVRCDEGSCIYVITGFSDYLTLVRSGIIVSLLLLTTSTVCLLLEMLSRSVHANRRHVLRTDTIKFYTSALGGVLAAASLALYGCKTVMARDRLPALSWGFAVTALSVKFTLLGAILRAMGAPSTWKNGLSCLVPKSQVNRPNQPQCRIKSSRLPSPEYCNVPREKPGLFACCQRTKERYTYISIPSPGCSTLDSNYRHYEEISFEDMPPPPLELLQPYPSPNLPNWLESQHPPAYPTEDWESQPPSGNESQDFGHRSLPRDPSFEILDSPENVDPSHAMRRSLQRASCSSRRPQIKDSTSIQKTQPQITPRQSKQNRRPDQLSRQSSQNSIYSQQRTRHGGAGTNRSGKYQTMPAAVNVEVTTRPPRTRPRGRSRHQRQQANVHQYTQH